MKIDGQAISSLILDKLKIETEKLKEKGIIPTLAIILVGENPASISYITQKEIKGELIGAKVITKTLQNDISQNELLEIIKKLNQDSDIHGIIVQRPLPAQIDENKIDQAVLPQKDIDGFRKESTYKAPIVLAINEILQKTEPNFKNKRIAIIGKGQTAGAPIIKWLINLGAYVNVVDSKTEPDEREEILKNSDIVISAVGKSNTVLSSQIKNGAILISIGLHKNEEGKMEGDYNEEEISKIASFYTPTPGGVGPINVACLFMNLLKAASIKEI